ncbi:M48 family metalloprotease [Thermodesulfobacterium hydrogeniphilum]|uniref:beta-barrel assembly-enhancing protease n=1 Tax=Thermodesulfobacterium hydrogeniphilum TaxID=161156 RepID=UPI0005700149|nr:M48 family metalloprotease [Thermodesulfobacterium hydrogeniphilum]
MNRFFIKVFLLVFFSLLLSSCTPYTGSKGTLFDLIPEEKEIQLGKLYTYSSIDEYEGLYPEKEVQNYVSFIGYKLTKVVFRKNLPYRFYVVNSGVINSFALPGGPVIITRGLLLQLDNESQLACVLGHELAHINARHHVKFLEKELALSLILQIGSIFLPKDLSGEALFKLGQISATLLTLKFSRNQEREADRYGIFFAYKAGYSPEGIIKIFKKFKKLEKYRPPEWLSTHPLPETRIKEAKKYIALLKPSGVLIKDTAEFHKIKKLLLQTKSSYDYVEKGKKAYKNLDYKKAEFYFKKATELYSKNTVAYVYLTSIKLKEKKFKDAQKYINKALIYDPNFFSANILAGITYFKLKKFDDSLKFFEKAKELVPFNGISYYYIGRIYEKEEKYQLALKNYKKALEIGPKNASWYRDCYYRYNKLKEE